MAGPGRAWRCLLTGLYICGGVSAGGCLVTTLMDWAHGLNCLPPVTDKFGDPVSVRKALGTVCDVIRYGSGATCALCLMLAITVNCCWTHWGCTMCHQAVTLLLCVMAVMCATALTVDFVLWCHALQNNIGHSSCERAASLYDNIHHTVNMTAYFRKMELQQVFQWALVPFLLCAVGVCSLILKDASASPPPYCRLEPTTGPRYILRPDESAPLLMAESSLDGCPPHPQAAPSNPSNPSASSAPGSG